MNADLAIMKMDQMRMPNSVLCVMQLAQYVKDLTVINVQLAKRPLEVTQIIIYNQMD